jgi:hypothetical protein
VLDAYVRPGVYLSDLAVGFLLLTSATRWRACGGEWGSSRLSVPFLALGGVALLTVPTALSPPLAAYTALRWLAAVLVYLALARADVALDRLVTVFLAGLGLHVLVGLGQILLQNPLGLPGELALEPSRSGAAIIDVGGTRWLRAYGLTFHPNVLGGCLAAGLLLGLPMLNRVPIRALWWLLWSGLLITFSRSAWLATAVAMPLVVGWLLRHGPPRCRRPPFYPRTPFRRALVVTLIGAALITALWVALLTGQLATRLQPTATPTEHRSFVERGALQAAGLDIILDHPLTGVGAGNAPLAMLRAEMPFPPQPVHNLPLLMAAEVGLLGGGLWLWLCLAPGMTLVRHLRRADRWAVALVGAWLALCIIGLWDSYPWALNAGRLLSSALLGLVSGILRDREEAWSRANASAC